jgi:hypothetical protein
MCSLLDTSGPKFTAAAAPKSHLAGANLNSSSATGGSWGLFQIASNHNFVSNCAGNLDNYLRQQGNGALTP